MSLSVVIPTDWAGPGVPEAVGSALRSAARLGPDTEVLLVGNGPRPRLDLRAPGLRVLQLDRPSAAGARNAGIEAAWHDAIAFTDDDCKVPVEWCAAMDAALNAQGKAAVAAPVEVTANGPVTAFIDYQRYFDAPAVDGSEVRYLITANAGVRRDRIPVRFDDVRFNNAAEDADLGYRLRDHGVPLHWLRSSRPVEHALDESVSQITERFTRYGRGNATLYRQVGRWREAVPGCLGWYADIVSGEHADRRRFDEIGSAALRRAFRGYDLLVTVSFLIGYLEQMSAELGYQLITVDEAGLTAGWQRLADDLGAVPEAGWRELPVDLGRLGSTAAVDPAVARRVGAVLREHAVLAEDVPDRVRAELDADAAVFEAELGQVEKRLVEACDGLAGRLGDLTPALLHDELRAVGTTYSDGCHDLERLLAGRPVGVPSPAHDPRPDMVDP